MSVISAIVRSAAQYVTTIDDSLSRTRTDIITP